MDRTERFHIIDQMLVSRTTVTREQFLQTLEVSPATFKRDLEYLRDRLGAPIIWDYDLRGYRYEKSNDFGAPYQLPGLWFNTAEIHALLTMNAWLENMQPEMLSDHIKPLQSRIRALLDQGDHSVDEITRRIQILTQPRKAKKNDLFQVISQALLNRKRLNIQHFNRQSIKTTEREISPQRLTFYRDNWYLDSWCHVRKAIRSFAVDALESVAMTPEKARDVKDHLLDKELSSGYGIFSGSSIQWAELKFSSKTAHWVAQEQWHPQQKEAFDKQGSYHLSIPYSQDTELIMDVLKYGAEVEVIKPAYLRKKIIKMIVEMSNRYQ